MCVGNLVIGSVCGVLMKWRTVGTARLKVLDVDLDKLLVWPPVLQQQVQLAVVTDARTNQRHGVKTLDGAPGLTVVVVDFVVKKVLVHIEPCDKRGAKLLECSRCLLESHACHHAPRLKPLSIDLLSPPLSWKMYCSIARASNFPRMYSVRIIYYVVLFHPVRVHRARREGSPLLPPLGVVFDDNLHEVEHADVSKPRGRRRGSAMPSNNRLIGACR